MKLKTIKIDKEIPDLMWKKINIWKDKSMKKVIKSLRAGKIVTVIDEYDNMYYIKCGWIKKGFVSKKLLEKLDG